MEVWKPKDGALSTNVVKEKTIHWCNKLHGKAGKLMLTMNKSLEHKEYSKPKSLGIEVEATDELCLLLIIYKKDF